MCITVNMHARTLVWTETHIAASLLLIISIYLKTTRLMYTRFSLNLSEYV